MSDAPYSDTPPLSAGLVGQRLTLRRVTDPDRTPPEIAEVEAEVTKVHPEHSLVVGLELSRYAYMRGYRERGRDIFARNPYGADGSGHRDNIFSPGGTNAYIVDANPGATPTEWIIVAQSPAPASGEQPGEAFPLAGRPDFSLVDAASHMADYLYVDELKDAFELTEGAVGECGYLEFLRHLEGHIIFPVVVAQAWASCEPGCPDGERQIRVASEFRKLWDRYRDYLEDPATLFE